MTIYIGHDDTSKKTFALVSKPIAQEHNEAIYYGETSLIYLDNNKDVYLIRENSPNNTKITNQ